MDIQAIVYTSNTGFTAGYAALLGDKTGLPVYPLAEARRALPKGTPVLYLGWLMAGTVKDCRKAARSFTLRGVCGVGLCDTGTLLDEVRRTNRLPESLPVFTLQGGMDHGKLRGLYASMIRTLTKAMAAKKEPTADDRRMLELLTTDASYVCEENLAAVLAWLGV